MNLPLETTPREWRRAAGWSLLVLGLSCVPYFIAVLITPESWLFVGFLVNPLDGHSYLAKMHQGVEGNWLFHLTYTPEPHDGALIFTFYLALGHLAAMTGLPKIIIFHLARLLAGFALLLMAYRFISRVTPHPTERRLAFIFILTASGLGWLGVIFGAFPIDLWVPEAFVPYSLYANPHFPLAMLLMLVIFEQILKLPSFSTSHPLLPTPYSLLLTPILWSGLAALALAMILPFALLTVWAVLALFLSWLFLRHRRLPWQQIWPTLSGVIFSAPIIFYQYWVSIDNPILAGWSAQNVTPAPDVLDFWLGYGLIGLLALVGAGTIVKGGLQNTTTGAWLVLLWAVTTMILVYIPFELQRRLITGLHLPLCILAAMGLRRSLAGRQLKASYQRLLTIAVVTLGALGTLFVWGVPLLGLLQSPETSDTAALFFLRPEERAAFVWLRQHSKPENVILASPRVGMFVPGQTGARTFYGHPFETIQAQTKKARAEAFYRGELEQLPPLADLIFYGPTEKELGRPEILSTLPVVYSAEGVTIYENKKE